MKTKPEFNKSLSKVIDDYDKVVETINSYIKTINTHDFSLFGPYQSYEEFPPDNICLIAHIFSPERRIGRVIPLPDGKGTKNLHKDLNYCLRPLSSQTLYNSNELVFDERMPRNLITRKRGVWLIYKTDLSIGDMMANINNYYRNYVKDMLYWKKTPLVFTEQFDLAYPKKKEWTQKKHFKRKSRRNKKAEEKPKKKTGLMYVPVPKKYLKRQATTKFENEDEIWADIYGDGITHEVIESKDNLDDTSSEDSQNKITSYQTWENSFVTTPPPKKMRIEEEPFNIDIILDDEIPEVKSLQQLWPLG